MNVTITVTYAGTDGNMPESAEVRWDDFEPADHPSGADIVDVLTELLAAPGRRRDQIFREVKARKPASGYQSGDAIRSGQRVQLRGNMVYPMVSNTVGECHGILLGASVSALVPLEYETALHPEDRVWRALEQPDNCQRVTCGHPHAAHSAMDDQGQAAADDPNGGACDRCGNYDQCRSFVGKGVKA